MPDDLASESKFQWLARLGFAVRGLLYIVIAVLVIATGRTEDLTGAMQYLRSGFGGAVMIVLVAGMAGYGLWRLSDAAFGMDSGRHHAKAWRRRTVAAFSGAIYLFLSWKGVKLMLFGRPGAGGAHEHAAEALHLPAGTLMVAIAAAVLFGGGLVQLYKAGSCAFLDNLDERAQELWCKWIGRIGYAARGVVFLAIAWLLARSALDHNAAAAGGLEQALDTLHGPLEYAVAAGLFVFGLYSLIEARFRSIHKPPTEHVKRKVEEKLAT